MNNAQIEYFMSSITKYPNEIFRLCMDLYQQKSSSARTASQYDKKEPDGKNGEGTFSGIIQGYSLVLKTLVEQEYNYELNSEFLIELHKAALIHKYDHAFFGALGCRLTSSSASPLGVREILCEMLNDSSNDIHNNYMQINIKNYTIYDPETSFLLPICMNFILNVLLQAKELKGDDVGGKILTERSSLNTFVRYTEELLLSKQRIDINLKNKISEFFQTECPKQEVNSLVESLCTLCNRIQAENHFSMEYFNRFFSMYSNSLNQFFFNNGEKENVINIIKNICKIILNDTITEPEFEEIFNKVNSSFEYYFNLENLNISAAEKHDFHDWFEYVQFGHSRTISNIPEKITSILKTYNDSIKSAANEDIKIQIIMNTIRNLERLHPFSDGNCRTFCTLLLNYLLLKNNLRPTLMENPNHFDGFSTIELIEKIKEGQDYFAAIFSDNPNNEKRLTLSLRSTEEEHNTYNQDRSLEKCNLLEICNPLIMASRPERCAKKPRLSP